METLAPSSSDAIAQWLNSDRIRAALVQTGAGQTPRALSSYFARFDRIHDHALGIRLKTSEELIGFYTLHTDPANLTGSVTLVIGDEGAHRQAVAIETSRALMDWAFRVLGLHKVSARVAENNEVTAGWLGTRLKLEGHLREHIRLPDGSRTGVLIYGLLRTEWEALRAWSVRNQQERHKPDTGVVPKVREAGQD